jgi:cobalt-zinc-cadmium efflux system outer membrane protein
MTLCFWPLPRRRAQAASPFLRAQRAARYGVLIVAVSAFASAAAAETASPVETLLAEAAIHNPEIAAARAESDAARQRIAPAAALEDPMLEVGVVNAPLPLSLRRDDMTMKMLGLSQKLPYPGKRELRRDVAVADATSVAHALDETVNRVLRDVRVTYEELRLTVTSQRLVTDSLETVRQLVAISQARYAVGQATQSDALQAQTQAIRMQQDLLRLGQEEQMRRSELRRLLGRRDEEAALIVPTRATLLALPGTPAALMKAGQDQRPQLQSLAALVDKSERELALARREYYPDFDVRLGYGQRERTLEGLPRDDMVTLTVAVNLPLWRKSRLAPRVAEAKAMRTQAASMAESQRLETQAMLERELAAERQQRDSATLYRSTLMPQTDAAFESALAAYRVGRVDVTTLLEARMRVYEAALGEAEAIAGHNKAVAEIDFLTGRAPDPAVREAPQP